MGYLRFFWTALYMVLALIITLPFYALFWIIGLFSMKARDALTLFVVRSAFRTILFLSGVKMHITGLDNIPKDEPVLYIGNHRGFFDVLTLYTLFPNMTAFIAKKSFKKVPLLSWWMVLLHNLFLDRNDIKQGLKVILTAIDYVKAGMSVCIFPEGTRNRTEEDMLAFHEGSFKVADKTSCPIIPVTMYNMSAVFEDHFPAIVPQHVMINFGEPIYPDSLSKEERKHLGAYTRDIMLRKYAEQKEEYADIIKK